MVNRVNKRTRFKQLIDYTETMEHEALKIGFNDCNIMALEAIDLMTGSDYSSLLKGQYKSYRKGLRLGKEIHGYALLSDLLKDIAKEIPVNNSHIGDILVQDLTQGKSYISCCYVCVGASTFLSANTQTKQIEVVYLLSADLEDLKAYRL